MTSSDPSKLRHFSMLGKLSKLSKLHKLSKQSNRSKLSYASHERAFFPKRAFLSLPRNSISVAHTGLALFQIMASTKDEEVLIVGRRDKEEYRHVVTSHHFEKMASPSCA